MEYEKQTFVNGQVLTAECLNRMEEGIKGACDAVPPACDSADCSKVLSHGANGCEWVDMPSGSSTLTVTVTDGVADHTPAEIYAHVQAGGTVVLLYSDIYFGMSRVDTRLAEFSSATDENIVDYVRVNEDGSVERYEHTFVTPEMLDSAGGVVSGVEPAEDDIPKVFFGGALQQTKDEAVVPFHYISKTQDISGYAEIKAQGNSSMKWNKKNQTVKLFKDAECTEKLKVDFKGWGEQNKFCFKANWIDLTHARNVVSARIWTDIVKSRSNYAGLPELLRNSPKLGAVDGFPVKVYAAGVYQGRYTLNIPKDKWTFNMDDELDEHCVLCGENYESGCFRAAAKINESDWTDEIHDSVPASILTRWNEVISFVMNATDDEFRENLGNYIDVSSLVDYHLFGLASCGFDAYGKNQIYATYDGQKWIASMYDMDGTWGLYWDGSLNLPTDYPRSSYEDFTSTQSSGEGNLLYIRLEQMFWPELQARWAELKAGVLTIENIINRFERFTDIAPAELVAEDYASTTGGGAFTGIPSQDTNNIQQIRAFALARLAWTDEYVNNLVYIPCTGITLSANSLNFSGAGTQTLTATVTPTDCTEKVVWESDDTEIATVSNGVVTPIADGNCTITATCGAYSATCSISVSGLSICTITNNLTNVTTDNASTTVVENGSYSANLAVTSDEYMLDTVTVTMGGVDVTNNVYSNGFIYIENATGDIVITATAKANPILYQRKDFAVSAEVWVGTDSPLNDSNGNHYLRNSHVSLETDMDITVVLDTTMDVDMSSSSFVRYITTIAGYKTNVLVNQGTLGVDYMGGTTVKVTPAEWPVTGDRIQIVLTHIAGSDTLNAYINFGGTVYTLQATGTYTASDATWQITNQTNFTQIAEFTVYNYAWTADEANAWLAE